jgi:hypothetical protein
VENKVQSSDMSIGKYRSMSVRAWPELVGNPRLGSAKITLALVVRCDGTLDNGKDEVTKKNAQISV